MLLSSFAVRGWEVQVTSLNPGKGSQVICHVQKIALYNFGPNQLRGYIYLNVRRFFCHRQDQRYFLFRVSPQAKDSEQAGLHMSELICGFDATVEKQMQGHAWPESMRRQAEGRQRRGRTLDKSRSDLRCSGLLPRRLLQCRANRVLTSTSKKGCGRRI